MEPQTIMVGVERTAADSREAIALGAQLARAHALPLVLAGVYLDVTGPGSHGYDDVLREPIEAELQVARASVPDDLDAWTRVKGSTSVVRGLHELAEECNARIMVLGPTHLGKAARLVSGDVTLGLLRAAPCAVAIAPPAREAPRAAQGVVGVAYVSEPEGREALEEAVDLAHRTGARLRILTVSDASAYLAELDARADVHALLKHQSAQALDEARAAVGDRVPVEVVALDGVPADELRAAAEGLDHLVMGSRAYGPSQRLLLGSVSSHVVHDAPCPVLVMPRGVHVAAAG